MTGSAAELSAASSVGLNEDKIVMNATYVADGIQCKLDCNGQQATLTFDGEFIDIEVHEPSQHRMVRPRRGASKK